MSQFFDIDFHLFPHFTYRKAEFIEQSQLLRRKLTDPDHPNYLWNPEYKTDVPADGFDIYAKNIWAVVKDNRDLDLPSQKEMLALFRCGEISDQLYAEFTERIAPTAANIKASKLEEAIGDELSAIVTDIMGNNNFK